MRFDSLQNILMDLVKVSMVPVLWVELTAQRGSQGSLGLRGCHNLDKALHFITGSSSEERMEFDGASAVVKAKVRATVAP